MTGPFIIWRKQTMVKTFPWNNEQKRIVPLIIYILRAIIEIFLFLRYNRAFQIKYLYREFLYHNSKTWITFINRNFNFLCE